MIIVHNNFTLITGRSKKATSQQDLDVTMKDRISAFESTDSVKSVPTQEKDAIKPKKKKPSSKAFQEFERSGIIIGFVSMSWTQWCDSFHSGYMQAVHLFLEMCEIYSWLYLIFS